MFPIVDFPYGRKFYNGTKGSKKNRENNLLFKKMQKPCVDIFFNSGFTISELFTFNFNQMQISLCQDSILKNIPHYIPCHLYGWQVMPFWIT